MDKEKLTKAEQFAIDIIELANKKGLTVDEFADAADTAKRISYHSIVDAYSIERFDFVSPHIAAAIDGKELFD